MRPQLHDRRDRRKVKVIYFRQKRVVASKGTDSIDQEIKESDRERRGGKEKSTHSSEKPPTYKPDPLPRAP